MILTTSQLYTQRIKHEGEAVIPTRKENDFGLASKTYREDAGITEERKRVMCLMSDTGGGHRASAQALKDGFHTLYGMYKSPHLITNLLLCITLL
jgi:hypothetical protein